MGRSSESRLLSAQTDLTQQTLVNGSFGGHTPQLPPQSHIQPIRMYPPGTMPGTPNNGKYASVQTWSTPYLQNNGSRQRQMKMHSSQNLKPPLYQDNNQSSDQMDNINRKYNQNQNDIIYETRRVKTGTLRGKSAKSGKHKKYQTINHD